MLLRWVRKQKRVEWWSDQKVKKQDGKTTSQSKWKKVDDSITFLRPTFTNFINCPFFSVAHRPDTAASWLPTNCLSFQTFSSWLFYHVQDKEYASSWMFQYRHPSSAASHPPQFQTLRDVPKEPGKSSAHDFHLNTCGVCWICPM